MRENKVILYENESGSVELRADSEKETVWATQDQIAKLFNTSKQSVSRHLLRIFSEGELDRTSVVKESLTTALDGKKYEVKLYNLDAIIAVGYRVNSKKATQFRIWATNVLREYVLSGYTLNRNKLQVGTDSLATLREAVDMLGSHQANGKLEGELTLKVKKKIL